MVSILVAYKVSMILNLLEGIFMVLVPIFWDQQYDPCPELSIYQNKSLWLEYEVLNSEISQFKDWKGNAHNRRGVAALRQKALYLHWMGLLAEFNTNWIRKIHTINWILRKECFKLIWIQGALCLRFVFFPFLLSLKCSGGQRYSC